MASGGSTAETGVKLATSCRDTAEVADAALAWFAANPDKVKQEAAVLAREFRKYATQARRLERAASRPMCVSVFGPSQAGKSYLVSALARSEAQPLMALFESEPINFVQKINPEGGGESTGLVTRFTIKRPGAPRGMPVILRLLSEADLIKILGNTYYSDFDLAEEEELSHDAVAQLIAELKGRAQSAAVDNGLSEDDVYDLREYFEHNFKDKAGIAALSRAGFWREAAALAPRLTGADRAKLFGAVWNGIEPLTALYLRLRGALAKLDFSADAYCSLEALVPVPRTPGDAEDQRGRSIINVRTLDSLGRSAGDTLEIAASNGTRASLERAEITALTAELTIVMAEQPWPFLQHTDLLDFPGARSRKMIPTPRQYLAGEGALREPFLRGKVAYLFQRYAGEQEINAMILCLAPGNQEVTSLPKIVNDWVALANGPTPEARARLETSLFVVLSKFDMEFEEKEGQSESSESRWKTRHINSFAFLSEGGAYAWPEQWEPAKPFANTFWLRNPNVKQRQLLQYGADDRETGLLPVQQPRVERMREEFLGTRILSQHFAEAAQAWDEAWTPNDGGVSYLAGRLEPVCEPALKQRQIAERLLALRGHMASRLQPFHVSGDLQRELEKRMAAAEGIADRLIEIASRQRFGLLLAHLQVTYDALVDAYYRVRMQASQEGNGEAPKTIGDVLVGRVPDAGKMRERLGIGRARPEGATAPRPSGEPLDQVDRFADAALAQWMQVLRSTAEDASLSGYFGCPAMTLGVLCDELIAGAKRLGLREQIAQRVRPFDAFRQTAHRAVAKPALVAGSILNAYVDWLGYDKVPPAERPRPGGEGRPIFAPREAAGKYPALAEEPASYDEAIYIDWITGFLRLVEENVRNQGGQSIDVAANARLGGMIERLAAPVSA